MSIAEASPTSSCNLPSKKQLDRWQRLSEMVTEGSWIVSVYDNGNYTVLQDRCNQPVVAEIWPRNRAGEAKANAEFVAQASIAVPLLVKQNKELRRAVKLAIDYLGDNVERNTEGSILKELFKALM